MSILKSLNSHPYTLGIEVQVEGIEGMTLDEIVKVIADDFNPQIVVWYIGLFGLKKTCSDFYKEFLFSPAVARNPTALFWLADLTAWGAFKNPLCSIFSSSRSSISLEKIGSEYFKCLRSSDFFYALKNSSCKERVEHIQNIMQRPFIWAKSKHFPYANISLRSIFKNDCPALFDWLDLDANKSYSALQYLEALFFIEEIFLSKITNDASKDIKIFFVLPNDEINYYIDKENSFEKDLRFFIELMCNKLSIKTVNLQIKFIAFKFGSHLQDRPYHSAGESLKWNKLTNSDIIALDSQKEVSLGDEYVSTV